MNVLLWILQILLALAFFAAGGLKATQPKDKLEEKLSWTEDFPLWFVRAIGYVELLGAAGLILPAVTGILPVLTPVAAVGLALTMLGAMVVHIRRKEPGMLVLNIVLCAMAVVVAWGRFGPHPL